MSATLKFKRAVLETILRRNPGCVLTGSLALWEPGMDWTPNDANIVYCGTSRKPTLMLPAVDRDTFLDEPAEKNGMSLDTLDAIRPVEFDLDWRPEYHVNFAIVECHKGDTLCPMQDARPPLGKGTIVISSKFPTVREVIETAHLTCCRIATRWTGDAYETLTGEQFSRTQFSAVEMAEGSPEHWHERMYKDVAKYEQERSLDYNGTLAKAGSAKTLERCRALADQPYYGYKPERVYFLIFPLH